MPADSLSWDIILHHCGTTCHEHPVKTVVGDDEDFITAPDHEFPSWLELRLTATDTGGLTHTQSLRLDPQTVPLTFQSQPPGLTLAVGSGTGVTPFQRDVIVGSAVSVSAVSPQTVGGQTYEFQSWSDGGGAAHDVTAGTTGATYTATYRVGQGPLTVEAEHFTGTVGRSDHSWVPRTDRAGFVGTSFMRNEPDNGASIVANIPTTSPELSYSLTFPTAGVYHVWLRTFAGNLAQDSAHVGLDGQVVATADKFSCTTYNVWSWCNTTTDGPVATVNVPSAGAHTVNVYMREDGLRLDRLVLTRDASYVPTGQGPPENLGGQPPDNPVPAISNLSPAAAVAGGPAFTLSVNGSNFVSGSEVRWAGTPKPTTFVSPTQLTAPITAADIAAAGSASVTVTNPSPGGGTSAPATFAIDPPTNPVPTTTGVSPASIVAGTAGVTLTVTGTGFIGDSVVRWNGSPRVTTLVSPTQVSAAIPASDVASPATASITVTNPAPGGGVSNAQAVAVTSPPAGNVLLSENFESLPVGVPPAGWTSTGNGTWSVFQGVSKVLQQAKVTTANLELSTGSATWTDYSVKADVFAPTDGSFFGVVGRQTDANNEYLFVLKNGNQWQLGKRVAGVFTQLGLGTFVYAPNSWHTLELTMAGSTISAKIDGTSVRTVTDAAFSAGRIGVRTNALVRYDNVVVTRLP